MENYSYWVETKYYLSGKMIAVTTTPFYPVYEKGEILDIELLPSAREKMRRPKHAMTRKTVRVKKWNKSLSESDLEHNLFIHKLTVLLEEVADDEAIDS